MIDTSKDRIFASRAVVWSTCLTLIFTMCLVDRSWYDRLYWPVIVGVAIVTLSHLYLSLKFATNVKRKSHKIPLFEIFQDFSAIVFTIVMGWGYHLQGGLADDPILDCTMSLCPYLY